MVDLGQYLETQHGHILQYNTDIYHNSITSTELWGCDTFKVYICGQAKIIRDLLVFMCLNGKAKLKERINGRLSRGQANTTTELYCLVINLFTSNHTYSVYISCQQCKYI